MGSGVSCHPRGLSAMADVLCSQLHIPVEEVRLVLRAAF